MNTTEFSTTDIGLSDEYKNMIDKVNIFIDEANKSNLLTCGKECQQNKTEQELYNSYLIKKTNLQNAPSEFEHAEKKYITTTKGYDYYNKFRENELKKDATQIIDKLNNEFTIDLELINSNLQNYKNLFISTKNMNQLNSDYVGKIATLEDELSSEQNKTNVANRKTFYDNQKINLLCSTNYYMKVLLWFIFISYIALAVVYKQYNKLHVRVGLILIPLLLYVKISNVYRRYLS